MTIIGRIGAAGCNAFAIEYAGACIAGLSMKARMTLCNMSIECGARVRIGCGSSREQVVWSLAGGGIRVLIAPRFGEIFEANYLRNGVLAITLDPATVDVIGAIAGGRRSPNGRS